MLTEVRKACTQFIAAFLLDSRRPKLLGETPPEYYTAVKKNVVWQPEPNGQWWNSKGTVSSYSC